MQVNKQEVKRIFNQVAKNYDKNAVVGQTAIQYLLDILSVIKLEPKVILDLGCGTGHSTKLLAIRYPNSKIIGVDFSKVMLALAETNCQENENVSFQLMDVEQLIFDVQSVDVVVANLLLPYCNQLSELLFRIRCLLKPKGLFIFSALGPNTLLEFKHKKINGLIDMHDIGDLLLQSQLLDPVTEMEEVILQYSSLEKMKQELVGMGIQPLVDSRIDEWFSCYENSSEAQNKFSVTFEMVYGHAWGSKQINVSRPMEGGEHVIDLKWLKGHHPAE